MMSSSWRIRVGIDVVGGGGQHRLEQVGRAARDRLLVAEDLLADGRLDRGGGAAVEALDVVLHLLRDQLVALAGDHVEHRLHADDLAGRRDQRRVAEVGADLRQFLVDLVELVERALLLELGAQVGDHAARDVVEQDLGVDDVGRALAGHALRGELARSTSGPSRIASMFEIALVGGLPEDREHRLDRGLGREAGHGGDRAVDGAGAGPHRREVRGGGHAAGGVGVDLDGHLDLLDQGGDELLRGDRREDAGHVLDDERVDAHLDLLLGDLDELLDGVDRADRVAEGALGVAAVLLHRLEGGAQVAGVVERVEDAEDVHPVVAGHADEALDQVVGVVLVAEHVLAAQQHLQRGLGAGLDLAQALPRVLAQEAHADVEGGAAPDLQRVVARPRRRHR